MTNFAMTTYKIIHYTNETQLGKTIYKTTVFNKTGLQYLFNAFCKKLNIGESVELLKCINSRNKKSISYVTNENGTLFLYS